MRFFIREALSLNEVLSNVSNSSMLKGFPLLDSETLSARACDACS
jgi:hypothetical protein